MSHHGRTRSVSVVRGSDAEFLLAAGPDRLQPLPVPTPTLSVNDDMSHRRIVFIRILALLCACSLSIGSHFATHMLGPLKSRLSREMGTDNTEFSLLLAAFSLNSTWTPLLGGVLASKLGTTFMSIVATGIIFIGQGLLLIGNTVGSVRLMVVGMFVFGLGVSPLAVAQEAIIVRFFKSHGLGMSMAFGLVAGKFASFIAARTSFQVSERFGPSAPFVVATSLTAFSVIMNLVYICASRWIVRGTGTELEANELYDEARKRSTYSMSEAQALEEVAKKRCVHLRDITSLGDVFWAYIGLNVFCGAIWQPFNHLAANLFEHRYNLSESDAGIDASYLLAGSVFLYPICGYVVDRVKARGVVLKMFALSSCLTLMCYTWLVLPPTITRTPLPAVACYGLALGFAPLLLVVLVPQLVSSKYISTTLGAHKSMEHVGQTIFQTLAGLSLDVKHGAVASVPISALATSIKGPAVKWDAVSVQNLLNTFFIINVLQLCSIFALARLQRRRAAAAARRASAASLRRGPAEPAVYSDSESEISSDSGSESGGDAAGEQQRLLSAQYPSYTPPESPRLVSPQLGLVPLQGTERTHGSVRREARRGRIFAGACFGLIAVAWVLFLSTAWIKLRARR